MVPRDRGAVLSLSSCSHPLVRNSKSKTTAFRYQSAYRIRIVCADGVLADSQSLFSLDPGSHSLFSYWFSPCRCICDRLEACSTAAFLVGPRVSTRLTL